MRKKTLSVIMLSLLTMLTLTSYISQNALAQPTRVLIGWSHPLTGPVAATCAVHHLYYKMIIHDYNEKYGGLNVPGIGVLPIEYIEYDDMYDPPTSKSNYFDLVEAGCDLLFAPWSTAFCTALFEEVFEAYEYPVIGLTVGSNELSETLKNTTNPWFWVTLGQPFEDALEFAALVSYINATVATADEIGKVGITYRDDEHGIEHANAIRDELLAPNMGIAVPVFESYLWYAPPSDWVPTINSFKSADVDVAMICGYDEGAAFIRACEDQKYNPKMVVHGPALETPFLVYDVFQFTPGEFAGLVYYNGFPATAYTTPELREWAEYHYNYTGALPGGFPYLPFPASAVFYAGLECLFDAVEEHGLDRPAIRTALQTETFDTIVGDFTFRKGESPVVENHGTLTQWQGGKMMDVIWPPCTNSSDFIIYPKFPWDYPTHLDLNKDRNVDMKDIGRAARAFGSYPEHSRWDEKADINEDDIVDILDIATVAIKFGETAAFGGILPSPPHP